MEVQENKPDLTQLSEQAKNQEGPSSFMSPGEKKKRGRPQKKENPEIKEQAKKEETQESHFEIKTAEILRPVLHLFSSGVVVPYVGHQAAGMTPDELEASAQALGLVIDKYLPNVLNKYGPEFMCLMVFGQYGLRVAALKKTIEIEKRNKEIFASQSVQKEQVFKDENSIKINQDLVSQNLM